MDRRRRSVRSARTIRFSGADRGARSRVARPRGIESARHLIAHRHRERRPPRPKRRLLTPKRQHLDHQEGSRHMPRRPRGRDSTASSHPRSDTRMGSANTQPFGHRHTRAFARLPSRRPHHRTSTRRSGGQRWTTSSRSDRGPLSPLRSGECIRACHPRAPSPEAGGRCSTRTARPSSTGCADHRTTSRQPIRSRRRARGWRSRRRGGRDAIERGARRERSIRRSASTAAPPWRAPSSPSRRHLLVEPHARGVAMRAPQRMHALAQRRRNAATDRRRFAAAS